jgi:site-specific DNA-methyltransferase (adenine-specific)
MKKIPDKYVSLIVTDPPYGINYKSSKQGTNFRTGENIYTGKSYFDGIKNDDSFPRGWAKECYRILKDNSAIYVFCHWKTQSDCIKELEISDFIVKNIVIINKSNHGMGDLKGSYAPKYELLIYAVKGRHILNKRLNDVWDMKVLFSGSKRYHPNEKPVCWYETPISNSSKDGDIVLDCFMGSSSCGIACINLNRKFIGYELDEKYFEIGKNRLLEAIKNKTTP